MHDDEWVYFGDFFLPLRLVDGKMEEKMLLGMFG